MITKSLYRTLLVGAALGAVITSCAGSDGKDGATGATGTQGANGTPGKAGPVGPAGADATLGEAGAAGASGAIANGFLNVSCLSPCHGFAGIVPQWQTSTHFATYISNLGGDEVASWTGATACGNCHAIDALEQRESGNVTFVGTKGPTDLALGKLGYVATTNQSVQEVTYAGHSTVAEVHCSTCHDTSADNDPHRTGAPYVKGSFPLRVPTGPNDQALIEKGSALGTSDGTVAGKYNVGNVCIFCHRSRKDVTNYVLASNDLTSSYWGPHEGPQADVYSGKGGYQYPGKSYGNSSHQAFTNGCVDCHMPPVDANQGIGNHSFYAQLSACQHQGCHVNTKSFDVIGGQSAMKANLQELRVALNTAGYLTRSAAAPYAALSATDLQDLTFSLDQVLPGATGLSASIAGALYNYLVLARGSAYGVHNPLYTRELIYDSYKAIAGTAPASLPTRP
ncbi:MAG: hypothetical protein ABI548_19610 [Polyangiaceae bacterium]